MSQDTFELSRRKVLGAVGTVGVASIGAGYGTTALFKDQESFDNNSLTAGELDLRIDWQQTYRNGSAGTPGVEYVNAHPDEGKTPDGPKADDGIQSIDTDQYETIDDVGLVEYTDHSRNLQEYLNCETLSNHKGDSFGGQDHLVELTDVKPGDSGEITFSFHLCDNPACVWLQGGNLTEAENGIMEPESAVDEKGDDLGNDTVAGNGELLENLQVRAWYDVDCDNVFEQGESKIFAWGTLDDLINDQLAGTGYRLNPSPYGISGVQPGSGNTSDFTCARLGKLEFTGDNHDDVDLDDDDNDDELIDTDDEDEAGTSDGDSDDNDDDVVEDRYKLVNNGDWAIIDITGFERKEDDEVKGFYFEIDDASDPDIGICQVDVKGGNSTSSYVFENLCIEGVNESGRDLRAPQTNGGQQAAVSNAVFYYCKSKAGIPCFPGGQTFCIGLEWFLPASVGNEIQSDSVAFDLGFYAEQARHNDDPGQTI